MSARKPVAYPSGEQIAERFESPAFRLFSFGGGTQSVASLVLAARGELPYRTFLFANVGDDSEHPGTLAYFLHTAMPFAREHGIELVELSRKSKYGSLLDKVMRLESSLPIPVRMAHTGKPGRRSCTGEWKIEVVAKECKRRGATINQPAVVGIGITTNEMQRMRSAFDPLIPYQLREYPLIELGLSRRDCQQVILDAGLPLPPRSACWFCPFHSGEEWQRLKREHPDLFERACDMEEMFQRRRHKLGKGPVYFTAQGARQQATLRELFAHDQLTFDSGLSCDGGYCMT